MKRATLLASIILLNIVFGVSTAFAAVTYQVTATTSDGSPLTNVPVGAQIILDISVTTTDFAFGVAGSVNNYNNTIVGLDAAGSTIAPSVFNAVCFPSSGCFGGISNQIGGAITFMERAVGPGREAEFLAALNLTAAGGNGSTDQPFPQFQIVYTALAEGTTTLNIGTYAEYLDGYTGTVDNLANNTSVTVTVPEPATIASSLAALGSVLGVAAIRRRIG